VSAEGVQIAPGVAVQPISSSLKRTGIFARTATVPSAATCFVKKGRSEERPELVIREEKPNELPNEMVLNRRPRKVLLPLGASPDAVGGNDHRPSLGLLVMARAVASL
jgi:hypothetical protein